MRIEGHRQTWDVHDSDEIDRILRSRDARGGAEFWLRHEADKYPCLAVRISGDSAEVHYFAAGGDPGHRAVRGSQSAGKGEMVTFVYDGCDPADGEEVPADFVLSFSHALRLAQEFVQTGARPSSVNWFEL